MKRTVTILGILISVSCMTLGQDPIARALPAFDLSRVNQYAAVQELDLEYDSTIQNIINEIELDSMVSTWRILTGEDSVRIEGKKVLIRNRIRTNNDTAAIFIKNKLAGYDLEVYDQVYSENGRNIYAVQTGSLYPEKQYILCAHYDAVADYCADDNASGVTAVLEAARILSAKELEHTLIYALWDEEEIGLKGSSYYASEAEKAGAEIRGVLNMDMISWDSDGDGLADIHSSGTANSDSLANFLLAIDSIYKIDVTPVVYNPGTGASDHSSFWNNDYGAVLLIEAYYGDDLNPYYHTSEDRIDKMDLSFFHSMSTLAIGAISALAGIAQDTTGINTGFEFGNRKNDGNSARSEVTIYPNPAGEFVMVQSSTRIIQRIEITSLSGQLVQGEYMNSTNCRVDISGLEKGIYFVTVRTGDLVMTEKIMKL